MVVFNKKSLYEKDFKILRYLYKNIMYSKSQIKKCQYAGLETWDQFSMRNSANFSCLLLPEWSNFHFYVVRKQSYPCVVFDIICIISMLYVSVMPEPGGGGQGVKYLADQLTLFQPGEGRLCPPINTGPPKFVHLPSSLCM